MIVVASTNTTIELVALKNWKKTHQVKWKIPRKLIRKTKSKSYQQHRSILSLREIWQLACCELALLLERMTTHLNCKRALHHTKRLLSLPSRRMP